MPTEIIHHAATVSPLSRITADAVKRVPNLSSLQEENDEDGYSPGHFFRHLSRMHRETSHLFSRNSDTAGTGRDGDVSRSRSLEIPETSVRFGWLKTGPCLKFSSTIVLFVNAMCRWIPPINIKEWYYFELVWYRIEGYFRNKTVGVAMLELQTKIKTTDQHHWHRTSKRQTLETGRPCRDVQLRRADY